MSPSSDERSPKRPRLSYYPTSPPTGASTETKTSIVDPPQTPPPSVRMSPSWSQTGQQALPGLGGGQNAGGPGSSSGSGSVTFPTPPSTAGFQSQMMARGPSSDAGSSSEQVTPKEEEGEGAAAKDGDGNAEMRYTPQGPAAGRELVDVNTVDEAEHRRSDHERQDDVKGGGSSNAVSAPPPIAGANVLYKLSTQPIPPSLPAPTSNLLHLYSLGGIQSTVARRDPSTGAKINILRKTYTGKVKDLGLEGRNKAVKNNRELLGLVDPGWDMVYPDGRTGWEYERENALLGERGTEERIEGMLASALGGMRAGTLPRKEHERWRGDLGLDETPVAAAPAATAAPGTLKALPSALPSTTKTATTHFLSKTAPLGARSSAPASPVMRFNNVPGARPERAGKKRRYDESSYEGYDDDGYDTSDTQRRGSGSGVRGDGKRVKRKDFPSNSPPFSNGATNPGGSGNMVGVRSS